MPKLGLGTEALLAHAQFHWL